MPPVRIADRRLWVGSESRVLLSGEFHYWRANPAEWPAILGRIRDLGLDIISTYAVWEFHEIQPGIFDFTGQTDTRRDLMRFLQLAAERGFWVIFRPGPYVYAEWTNMGVPGRVAHLHRLHPEFLDAAAGWITAVVEAARPYFATGGGPIVLLQADNEPDLWPRFYARALGLEDQPGVFQDWLRRRYPDIQALNDSWETGYTDFAQARAVMRPLFNERGYLNRYLDCRRFQLWYTAEIGRRAAGAYRQLGVDVPLLLNHYPGHMVQDWRALHAAGDLAGPDYYSVNEFRRDPTEQQEFLHLMRYTRVYSPLPFSPEFQAGTWHGFHYHTRLVTPNHTRLMALSALLAGLSGWNWYMLVNRDNWYMAPINEWGRARPELFAAYRQMADLFRAIDPPSLEKLTDTAIALGIVDRGSEIGGFNDTTLRACYLADVDYECYDLAAGSIVKPLMFYSGGRWMSQDDQARLLAYVESGGNLIFFQHLPALDETLCPLNLLGLRAPDGLIGGGSVLLRRGDHTVALDTPTLFLYDNPPGEPIFAQRMAPGDDYAEESHLHFHLTVGLHYAVGYTEKRGLGTITVLGAPPDPALVLAVHGWFGVPLYSRARSAHISTALFRRGETFLLIATNNGESNVQTTVDLHPDPFRDGDYRARDLLTGQTQPFAPRKQGFVALHLPGKDGTVIEISPL